MMRTASPELCRRRDKLARIPRPERQPARMKPGRRAHDYGDLLRSGVWFRSLPADFQDTLLHTGVLREIKEGQHLVTRGDAPKGLTGVVEGALRLSTFSTSGREALLMLLEPPTWVGEIALFDGLASTHDVIADSDSLVVHVSQAALEPLLTEHPAWWKHLGRLMAQQMRLALLALEEAALLPASVRLARRLVLMAHQYGHWDGHSQRVIGVRQEQLAMMLCLSRQTTNQLLKSLEAQGAIQLRYGEIELLDLEKLRELGTSTE